MQCLEVRYSFSGLATFPALKRISRLASLENARVSVFFLLERHSENAGLLQKRVNFETIFLLFCPSAVRCLNLLKYSGMSSDAVPSLGVVADHEIITLSDHDLEEGEVVDDEDAERWTCNPLTRDDDEPRRSVASDRNGYHRCDICGAERPSKSKLDYHKSREHLPLVSFASGIS